MSVVVNEAALGVLLESEFGPVGIDTARRSANVLDAAYQKVSQTYRVRTGALLRSLTANVGRDAFGLRGRVYCDADIAPHAVYLELGTVPHVIRAINHPRLISAPGHPDPLTDDPVVVNHPGNSGSHFLWESLTAAAL